jgi:hypothetical protein
MCVDISINGADFFEKLAVFEVIKKLFTAKKTGAPIAFFTRGSH